MKLSLFTFIFKDKSLEETVKIAKDLGFDGIELWGGEPHISSETSRERAREIRDLLDMYGLGLPIISTCIGDFSILSDYECTEAYKKLDKYLNFMESLKCDLIRVDCGGPNTFLAQKYHYEKALYWMQKCADLAAQYKCKIAMEIRNGSLIETVESADKFINALNRKNVGVIHNAGNMYITDTDYGFRSVEILGKKIFHVHVKDELRVDDDTHSDTFHDRTIYGHEIFQQKLLGEGAVDYVPLIKALIKTGYNGFLSSECHADVPDFEKARHEIDELKKQVWIAERSLCDMND